MEEVLCPCYSSPCQWNSISEKLVSMEAFHYVLLLYPLYSFYFRKTSQYGSSLFCLRFHTFIYNFRKTSQYGSILSQYGSIQNKHLFHFRKTSQYGSLILCIPREKFSYSRFQKNQLVWKFLDRNSLPIEFFKFNFRKTSQYGSSLPLTIFPIINRKISEKLVSMEVTILETLKSSIWLGFQKNQLVWKSIFPPTDGLLPYYISEKLVSMEARRIILTIHCSSKYKFQKNQLVWKWGFYGIIVGTLIVI